MPFPKYTKVIDESQIKMEHKYLVKKYELILDRLRCVGCGQCSTVCPKDAIIFGPASSAYETKPKELNVAVIEAVDPEKCVMCGTCVAFCPFDAIHLYEDGEKIKEEQLKIIEHHAIPHLESTAVFCSHLGRDARIYWEGNIEVTLKMHAEKNDFKQYYLNKCPGDCHKCDKICPTEAIKFKDLETAWKSKILIDIDDKKCIRCGACQLVCPQDNFKVKWTKVKTSGPYNQIFWDPLLEKLLDQRVVFIKKKE